MRNKNAVNDLINIVFKFGKIQRKHVKYILQYVGAMAINNLSRVQDIIDDALETGKITQYKRGKDTILVVVIGGLNEAK